MCYSQIWQNFRGDEYLCKLGKKYLNALFYYANFSFILYSILKLLTYHTSFYH